MKAKPIKPIGMGKLLMGAFTIGFCIGHFIPNYPLDKAKVFEMEDGRRIIRTYRPGNRDDIFIQPTTQDSFYVRLEGYLEKHKILNTFDRYLEHKIEEDKIKKLVKW